MSRWQLCIRACASSDVTRSSLFIMKIKLWMLYAQLSSLAWFLAIMLLVVLNLTWPGLALFMCRGLFDRAPISPVTSASGLSLTSEGKGPSSTGVNEWHRQGAAQGCLTTAVFVHSQDLSASPLQAILRHVRLSGHLASLEKNMLSGRKRCGLLTKGNLCRSAR